MTDTANQVTAVGAKFYPVKADLLSLDCLDKIISGALSAAGRIDILVNNAGIIRRADLADYTVSDWDDVMNRTYARCSSCRRKRRIFPRK